MSRAKSKSSIGLTPAKSVLIGVLGLILIAVVAAQFGGTGGGTKAAQGAKPRGNHRKPVKRVVATKDEKSSKDQAGKSGQPSTWPEYSLEAVQSHDPFATPGWTGLLREFDTTSLTGATDGFSNNQPDPGRQLLENLRATGVSMVIITDDVKVAKVGELDLRVGDQVGEFFVKEITTDGVTLIKQQKK